MRITSGMAQRSIQRDMIVAREARQKASDQVSSGKRVTRLSDDPAAALDALRARRELQRSQAYNRQAADADGWLTTYDTSMQTISDRLIRVRELALQGASSGVSGGAISPVLTQEISSIREELASLANQKYLGKPVFAGTAEPANVYSAAYAYQGDNGQFLRTIASGVTLQVNYAGPAVFGSDASPTQMFAVLQDIESKITTGDAAGLATAISNLDTARERVDTLRVQVGVKQNTVKSIQEQRSNVEIDLRAQLSAAEDVDIAQASIDLNAADLAYKATLSAAARLFQTSLVDFLR
jgi:flagellar hook-associated protein 3 FlgL